MAAKAGQIFAFGKHRGKTFKEVAEDDPSYCTWAKRTENPSGALKDFIAFLEASGSTSASAAPARPAAAQDATRLGSSGAGLAQAARAASGGDCGQSYNGPKLDEDLTLVMELCSDDQFVVRAERSAGMARSMGKGSTVGRAPYLQPAIWHGIKSIQGCRGGGDSHSFVFPRNRLEAVAQSLERIGKVERVPAWVVRLLRESSDEAKKGDCLMEERLPEKLLAYQREGVDFGLAKSGRCLIGDEMGLGKTLQALALAAQYAEEWPVLVLCPSSLRWVWKEQVEEWLPEFVDPEDIQVIKKGSDKLRSDARFWIISYAMWASDAKKKQSLPDTA